MDRVDLHPLGEVDDSLDVEIRGDGTLALADLVGLVGLEPVEAEAVFPRVHRDRRDAELGGRAHDADGDLGPVRDQKALHSYCSRRPTWP
jgi:hypothetical protein